MMLTANGTERRYMVIFDDISELTDLSDLIRTNRRKSVAKTANKSAQIP